MPCVRGEFSGGQIFLQVGFFNPSEMSTENNVLVIKKEKRFTCQALMDTGATNSCITKKIAQSIGLRPDGEELVGGVHGRQKTKIYTAGLVIPEVGYKWDEISVFEANFADNSPYQALLGMDVLCVGSFQLDFSGNFLFCV